MFDIIIFLVICSAGGVFSFFDGFRRWRRKRMIDNIPTSKIYSMALGLVEVTGKAKQRVTLLKSPLTGNECVFYKFIVEKYIRRGRSSTWVMVAEGNSFDSLFYIQDETGKVLIDPTGAELKLGKPGYSFKSGLFTGYFPQYLLKFLKENNIKYNSLFGTQKMRFREWRIFHEDTIYVLGTAMTNSNFISDFKLRLNQKLKEIKAIDKEMKKLDTNGDGRVGIDEWDEAVRIIRQKIIEDQLEHADVSIESPLIIGKGKEEKIFILSNKREKDLRESLSWEAIGEIIGGALLAIICLSLLFHLIIKYCF